MRTMPTAETWDRGDDVARERADVALARAGNLEAFERLYRAHVARVLSTVRRLLGENRAEEETQEVFVRAWQSLGTFRAESRFGTWLHRLAVNHCISRLRTHRGEEEGELKTDAEALAEVPPEGRLDLERALRRLPASARRVVVLHDCFGHTHLEIATLLGITAGTSKSQLHRGRLLLRAWIAPASGGTP